MARKLSTSTAITGANVVINSDYLMLLDVSDTTDGSGGTNKKILASEYLSLGGLTPLHVIASLAAVTATNQPNSEEFLLANNARGVQKFNASKFTHVRLSMNVVVGSSSSNTPIAYLKYKTTYTAGDGVETFTTIGAGSGSDVISLTTAGVLVTLWIALPAGARGDVFFCVATNGGNDVADPSFGNTSIQFDIQ